MDGETGVQDGSTHKVHFFGLNVLVLVEGGYREGLDVGVVVSRYLCGGGSGRNLRTPARLEVLSFGFARLNETTLPVSVLR